MRNLSAESQPMEGPAGTTICPEMTSFHQSSRWPRQAGIVCIVREYLVGGEPVCRSLEESSASVLFLLCVPMYVVCVCVCVCEDGGSV